MNIEKVKQQCLKFPEIEKLAEIVHKTYLERRKKEEEEFQKSIEELRKKWEPLEKKLDQILLEQGGLETYLDEQGFKQIKSLPFTQDVFRNKSLGIKLNKNRVYFNENNNYALGIMGDYSTKFGKFLTNVNESQIRTKMALETELLNRSSEFAIIGGLISSIGIMSYVFPDLTGFLNTHNMFDILLGFGISSTPGIAMGMVASMPYYLGKLIYYDKNVKYEDIASGSKYDVLLKMIEVLENNPKHRKAN